MGLSLVLIPGDLMPLKMTRGIRVAEAWPLQELVDVGISPKEDGLGVLQICPMVLLQH